MEKSQGGTPKEKLGAQKTGGQPNIFRNEKKNELVVSPVHKSRGGVEIPIGTWLSRALLINSHTLAKPVAGTNEVQD